MEALGSLVAVHTDEQLYEKFGKSQLIALKRKSNEGYNFNEAEHFNRVGVVKYANKADFVEDEFRRIANELKVGDEVLFAHDVVKKLHNVDDEKVQCVDITRCLAFRRDGNVKAISDFILCRKREEKTIFGNNTLTYYEVVYPSDPMRYTQDGLFNGEMDVKVGDRLIIRENRLAYEVESEYHRLFFDEPIYAIQRFMIIATI